MAIAQAEDRSVAGAISALLLVLAVSGCIHQNAQCQLAAQSPMKVTEVFFGRDIRGRAPLTDSEWSDFASSEIAKEFPAGFTVLDGEGGWHDPVSGRTIRERTKILLIASSSEDAPVKADRIAKAYRTAYHQSSVGMLVYDACGSFEN